MDVVDHVMFNFTLCSLLLKVCGIVVFLCLALVVEGSRKGKEVYFHSKKRITNSALAKRLLYGFISIASHDLSGVLLIFRQQIVLMPGNQPGNSGDVELKIGYMVKRSQGKSTIGAVNFKKRVFVLTCNRLLYFDGNLDVSLC